MDNEIIQKIQDAVKKMGERVKFVARPRHYEKIDGQWLQGASTVSSIVPKNWLAAWGAKEAVKALGYSDYPGDTALAMEMLAKIKSCIDVVDYITILKEAKGASRRKSMTALVDGKTGHAWLENYVKAKIENKPLPIMPQGTLLRPITQFLVWEREEVDCWILSEALVAYPERSYAGTLDGMAMMRNGKLALIDFKFASHISEDYYLQTAGYAAAFEPYGITVDNRIIIRLPKTLEKEEWDDKTFRYRMIPNNIEVDIVNTDYVEDRDIFFGCLPLKKWINKMEKRSERSE